MDIKSINKTTYNSPYDIRNTENKTKSSKIEVIVGALTENDVKDHGTSTGVVKTVSKLKRKPKIHTSGELEKRERLETVGKDEAKQLVANITQTIAKEPASAISAQANQEPQAVFKLL